MCLLGINKSSMKLAGGLSLSRACISNLYFYVVPVSLVQACANIRASASLDFFYAHDLGTILFIQILSSLFIDLFLSLKMKWVNFFFTIYKFSIQIFASLLFIFLYLIMRTWNQWRNYSACLPWKFSRKFCLPRKCNFNLINNRAYCTCKYPWGKIWYVKIFL